MQTSPGGRKSTPATTPPVGAPDRNANGATAPRHATRRLSTETKAAFKTTEFFAYVAVLAGILIAGALVDSSDAGGYGARQVWLVRHHPHRRATCSSAASPSPAGATRTTPTTATGESPLRVRPPAGPLRPGPPLRTWTRLVLTSSVVICRDRERRPARRSGQTRRGIEKSAPGQIKPMLGTCAAGEIRRLVELGIPLDHL